MVYCYQYVHVRNKDFGIRTVEQLFLHPRGVQWHTHIQYNRDRTPTIVNAPIDEARPHDDHTHSIPMEC